MPGFSHAPCGQLLPRHRAGYTTGMDDEPPLTDDERAWFAELVRDVGPEGARLLADLLGLDDV